MSAQLCPQVITEAEAEVMADFARLTDMPYRQDLEPQQQIFIAEGAKVIARALSCGYQARAVLLEQKWWPQLQPWFQRCGQTPPVYLASAQLLQQITGYRVHRGALASFARKPLPKLSDLLADVHTVAVLEDLVDHTNLGAIIRSAAALGVQALVLSPGCADPLYRRSLKVSMGAVLALPYTVAPQWPQALQQLSAAGFDLWGLTPQPDAAPITALPRQPGQRVALLLGAEGPGLSHQALAASTPVRIPMATPHMAPGPLTQEQSGQVEPVVDSLNVASAAAIAFYLSAGAGQAAFQQSSLRAGSKT